MSPLIFFSTHFVHQLIQTVIEFVIKYSSDTDLTFVTSFFLPIFHDYYCSANDDLVSCTGILSWQNENEFVQCLPEARNNFLPFAAFSKPLYFIVPSCLVSYPISECHILLAPVLMLLLLFFLLQSFKQLCLVFLFWKCCSVLASIL